MTPNTLGIKFLRLAVAEGATAAFRRHADPSLYLTEPEQRARDVVEAHVSAFGGMPGPVALATEGIVFPSNNVPEESLDYYGAQLYRRAGYGGINERFPALQEAMKNMDMDGVLTVLRDMLSVVSSKTGANNYSTLAFEAQRVLSDYRFAKQHPGLRGVTLRWPTLNDVTNGAMGGDLIVVAGRPGMGKSWILLELALAAFRSGRTVAFASMEMALLQIARRWLGGMTGINPNSLRAGEIPYWSEVRLLELIAELSTTAPVHLFRGETEKSVAGLEAMMDEFEPDILYVDAAYLLSPAGRSQGYITRWESISKVVSQLKQLSLRKDRPIVLSVQFNRNAKHAKGHKQEKDGMPPDLADIAGSDSIPQDASIVLGATYGRSPFKLTRREIHNMKNREGETKNFGINFTFNPVNFDEVELSDSESDAPIADLSWML